MKRSTKIILAILLVLLILFLIPETVPGVPQPG